MASQRRKPRMVKVICRMVRTTKRSRRKLATLDSGADVLNPSAMHIERVSDESDPITNETINGISLKLSQGLHLEISRSREIN